jgi:adenine-specific DNA-methyltransferase
MLTVSEYCDSKPGIVTAANDFFIISKEKEKRFNLSKYTKPIIQKGLFVNGSVVFDKTNLAQLDKKQLPTKFLHLTDETIVNEDLAKYLALGANREIPKRYKCLQRNNWYVVPNVSTVPSAFFFKRSHLYPKLLKNNSDAFVTDSAYKIEMKKEYDVNSFIYSFYNSLTLLFAEIEGRYYGGGVLELTPSEFKKIPIPYSSISEIEFKKFTTQFENKENIDDVLRENDYKILHSTLGLNLSDIRKVEEIRGKLIVKRMRKY